MRGSYLNDPCRELRTGEPEPEDAAAPTEPAPPPPPEPAPPACPVVRGHLAPVHEPELTVNEPEHRHVRVGGLEFCFRNRRDQGWTYEGGFLVGSRHVVDQPLWTASFAVARDRMVAELTGATVERRPARCPYCGQLFAGAPVGRPPYEWECAPQHRVRSAEGHLTTYDDAGQPCAGGDDG